MAFSRARIRDRARKTAAAAASRDSGRKQQSVTGHRRQRSGAVAACSPPGRSPQGVAGGQQMSRAAIPDAVAEDRSLSRSPVHCPCPLAPALPPDESHDHKWGRWGGKFEVRNSKSEIRNQPASILGNPHWHKKGRPDGRPLIASGEGISWPCRPRGRGSGRCRCNRHRNPTNPIRRHRRCRRNRCCPQR